MRRENFLYSFVCMKRHHVCVWEGNGVIFLKRLILRGQVGDSKLYKKTKHLLQWRLCPQFEGFIYLQYADGKRLSPLIIHKQFKCVRRVRVWESVGGRWNYLTGVLERAWEVVWMSLCIVYMCLCGKETRQV